MHVYLKRETNRVNSMHPFKGSNWNINIAIYVFSKIIIRLEHHFIRTARVKLLSVVTLHLRLLLLYRVEGWWWKIKQHTKILMRLPPLSRMWAFVLSFPCAVLKEHGSDNSPTVKLRLVVMSRIQKASYNIPAMTGWLPFTPPPMIWVFYVRQVDQLLFSWMNSCLLLHNKI